MITSHKNPWFRRFRDALRHHQEEIVIEGPKAIRDAIDRGWQPVALAAARSDQNLPRGIPTHQFDAPLFAELSDTVTSQGILGLFRRFETPLQDLLGSDGVVVVLDGVQDPGNVGTMIRLAAAFDAAGVVLTEGSADPLGPKAIRASAGAVLDVPFSRTTRQELVRVLRREGIQLWAAAPDAANTNLPPTRVALAFGSEGQGIHPELLAVARRISIPMSGRAESLNVAAAGAILLSNLYQRRRGTFSAQGKSKEKPDAG